MTGLLGTGGGKDGVAYFDTRIGAILINISQSSAKVFTIRPVLSIF
jgi:hypothetical protein